MLTLPPVPVGAAASGSFVNNQYLQHEELQMCNKTSFQMKFKSQRIKSKLGEKGGQYSVIARQLISMSVCKQEYLGEK